MPQAQKPGNTTAHIDKPIPDKHYLDFLPAAIEIEQSPPSLYGRLIMVLIIALVVLGIAWSYFGRVDIVAVAPGKIIPTGKAKIIQPYERSVIKKIHVREGQRVAAGEVLVSLDTTISAADERLASRDLREAQTLWLLELGFKRYLENPGTTFNSSRMIEQLITELDLPAAAVDIQRQSETLSTRVALLKSRLTALEGELNALHAEHKSALAAQRRYQQTLPIIEERAASISGLYQRQLASRDQYLQLDQQRIEQRQGLESEAARVEALEARLAQTAANITALQQQERGQNLLALGQARHRTYSLEQDQQKARQRQRLQQLHAPVHGIVQQLQVHTAGGIVTPAQKLMTLIPLEEALEIEAFVRNQDIGFVEEGQQTAVKIDTFNFTRYGAIEGKIKTLSMDAVDIEGLGLVYPARVLLARNSMTIQGKSVSLSAGMAVTVEIKTGTRRIIEFFLSPLLKAGSESIRER